MMQLGGYIDANGGNGGFAGFNYGGGGGGGGGERFPRFHASGGLTFVNVPDGQAYGNVFL